MTSEALDIAELVRISRYAGGRFDLVQAGGGNASVKLPDGRMLIKASGCLLSEVGPNRGWVAVDNRSVLAGLSRKGLASCADKRTRESMSAALVKRATVESPSLARPSIETVMHSGLARYTLHTHPLVVNAVACRRDWRRVLSSLFEDPALVAYRTPGIDLALEVGRVCDAYRRRHGKAPKIYFLQNHGLITSSDDPVDIVPATEAVLTILERHLSADMRRYKAATTLAKMLEGKGDAGVVVMLSEDALIQAFLHRTRRLFRAYPFCPDGLVYCGIRPLQVRGFGDHAAIARHRARYHERPKVIVYRGHVYFAAQSVRKAREIEEVFKFHLSSLAMAGGSVRSLAMAELAYLGNWESENYRQRI